MHFFSGHSFFVLLVMTGTTSTLAAVAPTSPNCGGDDINLGLLGNVLDVTFSLLDTLLCLPILCPSPPPQPCKPTSGPASTTDAKYKNNNFLVLDTVKRISSDISISGLFLASESVARFNVSSNMDLVGCASCSLVWGAVSELAVTQAKSLYSHLGFNVTSNGTLRLVSASLQGKSTRADPAYQSQDGPIFIDQNARFIISADGAASPASVIGSNARVQFLNGAKMQLEPLAKLQVSSSTLDFGATTSVQLDQGAQIALQAQSVLQIAAAASININLASNSLFSIDSTSTLSGSASSATVFNLQPTAQFAVQAGAHLDAGAAALTFNGNSGASSSLFNVFGNLTSGALTLAGGSSQVSGRIAVPALDLSGSLNLDLSGSGEIQSTSVNVGISGLLRVRGALDASTLSQTNGNITIESGGKATISSLTMQSGLLSVLSGSRLSVSSALQLSNTQVGISLSTDSSLDVAGGLSALAGIEFSASNNSTLSVAGQLSLGAQSSLKLDLESNLLLPSGDLAAVAKIDISASNNSTLSIGGQLALGSESRVKIDSGSKISLAGGLSLAPFSLLSAEIDSEIDILGGVSLDANAAVTLSNGVKLSAHGDATVSSGVIALQTAARANLASSLSLDTGASVLLGESTDLTIGTSLNLGSNSALTAGLNTELSVGEIINLSGSASLEVSGSVRVPRVQLEALSAAIVNTPAIVSVTELLLSGSTLQIAGETNASAKVSVLNGASLTILGSLISSNSSSILEVDASTLTVSQQGSKVSMGVLFGTANSNLNIAGALEMSGNVIIRDSLLHLSDSGIIQASQVVISAPRVEIAGTIRAETVTISGNVKFGNKKPSQNSNNTAPEEPAKIDGDMHLPPNATASGPVNVNGTFTNEGNITTSSSESSSSSNNNTVIHANHYQSKNGSTIKTTFSKDSNESHVMVYSTNATVESGSSLEVTTTTTTNEPGQRVVIISCSDSCDGEFSSYSVAGADGTDQTCQWEQQSDGKQLAMLFVGPSRCGGQGPAEAQANEARLQMIISIVIPVIIVAIAAATLVVVFAVPRLRMRVMPFLERRLTVQSWSSGDDDSI